MIFALIIIFSGCVSLTHKTNTTILFNQLNTIPEKYGIILLRTAYFNDSNPKTICKQNLGDLKYKYIHIDKNLIHKAVINLEIIDVDVLLNFFPTIDINKALNEPGIKKSYYLSEFFYNIKLLPEGKYYFYLNNYRTDQNLHYVYVKQGEVNYIGDYYLINSKKNYNKINSPLKHKPENTIDIVLCDRFSEAKKYFKKYDSNINPSCS